MEVRIAAQIGRCTFTRTTFLPVRRIRQTRSTVIRAEETTETETKTAKKNPILSEEEKAVKKLADTFAPRPSGKVQNPATRGTLLYDIFGYQAYAGVAIGGLLSYNILFPSDDPTIAKLLGMWSIWMFTIPSLRARECTTNEKSALNILFLLLPLMNITLPLIWKSFPFVFTSDVIAVVSVFLWKSEWNSTKV